MACKRKYPKTGLAELRERSQMTMKQVVAARSPEARFPKETSHLSLIETRGTTDFRILQEFARIYGVPFEEAAAAAKRG